MDRKDFPQTGQRCICSFQLKVSRSSWLLIIPRHISNSANLFVSSPLVRNKLMIFLNKITDNDFNASTNKYKQEKNCPKRCALSLLFSHGKKLNTTQRGAAQERFLLLFLFSRFRLKDRYTLKSHLNICQQQNQLIQRIFLKSLDHRCFLG